MISQKKKENVEEKAYIVEKIPSERGTDEGKLECFLKWKGVSNSDNEWKSAEMFNYPELSSVFEDSLSYKSSKKRKLGGSENITSGSVQSKKACVEESNGTLLNINCLPEDMILEIFRHLSHKELCYIAQVCKRWHELSRCPSLWKKVVAKFQGSKSQNKAVLNFSENLPTYVTHLKFKFENQNWEENLKFEEVCKVLGGKCPSLKAFSLHFISFSVSYQSAIDLCRQYIPSLEVLSIHDSEFTNFSLKGEYSDFSKIKVLDLRLNFSNFPFRVTFSKMSNLKELHLVFTRVNDTWFEDDISFLHNLEILNLQWASEIGSRTFQVLQNHALKLTDLFLCFTHLNDSDLNFRNSVFPHLRTICLKDCSGVTCEGIVSFVRSCQSLQNVYVDREVAESYAKHPFIVNNQCKLKIVKNTDNCWPHMLKDYL